LSSSALRSLKDQRLNLRVSEMEKATLEAASAFINMSTSEFVIRQAMASAEVILADRTRFVLPVDQWEEFGRRVDQPPRTIPAIAKLMTESALLDD
jgi:uncharacterized protein (DUF1778 family)